MVTRASTSVIKDGAITTAKIADEAVTSGKIPNGAVTTDKIPDSAITTQKINDGAVTTDKIPDSAITTQKINDGAVALAKIAEATIGDQSEHDSPSGVEKLARLDRLEEAGWIGAGKVIQEVVSTQSTSGSSSSGEWSAFAGLTVDMTPKRSGSVIEVVAYLPFAQARRISDQIPDRYADFRIQNFASGATGPSTRMGRFLASQSVVGAASYGGAFCHFRETAGSTIERTYRVQMRSSSSNIEVSTNASATEGLCTIIAREIAQ